MRRDDIVLISAVLEVSETPVLLPVASEDGS